jgi:hypothetical protein
MDSDGGGRFSSVKAHLRQAQLYSGRKSVCTAERYQGNETKLIAPVVRVDEICDYPCLMLTSRRNEQGDGRLEISTQQYRKNCLLREPVRAHGRIRPDIVHNSKQMFELIQQTLLKISPARMIYWYQILLQKKQSLRFRKGHV